MQAEGEVAAEAAAPAEDAEVDLEAVLGGGIRKAPAAVAALETAEAARGRSLIEFCARRCAY